MSQRVLMLAPFFVPRKRVGALRPYKFVTNLPSLGWTPGVVYFDTPGETLSEAEARNTAGCARFPLRLPFDRTRRRSGSDLTASSGRSPGATAPRGGVDLTGLVDARVPTDTWMPFFVAQRRSIQRIVESFAPQVLWTTGDPWSGFMAGLQLAERFELPWVVDFRDPWLLDPNRYTLKKRPFVRALEARWEQRVIQRADGVVFTSAETLARYAEAYPDHASRFHLIHNAWQLDAPPEGEQTALPELPFGRGDLDETSFLFFGKFRDSSPAAALVPMLDALRSGHAEAYGKFRLFHVGELEPGDREALASGGHLDRLVSFPAVPYAQSAAVLRRADVLVSVLSPTRNLVMPTKFFDYLPAGRPVLSIGTNRELAELLSATGIGRQFAWEEGEAAATEVARLIASTRVGAPPSGPALAAAAAYSSEAATRKLVAVLESARARRAGQR